MLIDPAALIIYTGNIKKFRNTKIIQTNVAYIKLAY